MNTSPSLRRWAPAAAISAVAIGVLAFAVAVGSGSLAPAPASAVTPAGNVVAGNVVAAVDTGWVAPTGGSQAGSLEHGRFGPGGMGMRGHGPFGAITITKIDGSKLSLQTEDGWTRTIDATGATVTKAGQTVQLSALKVGDQVVFGQERQTDGTFKITAIRVVLPSVTGIVTAVDASSVTVAIGDGTTKKIVVNSSTVYRVGGTDASKSAVVVGIRISAEGTLATDGTFTASAVEVAPATVVGTVASKSSSSFTVTARDGSTVTVKVTSSTTYQAQDVTSPGLKDVAVGAVVAAQGTRNSDGSLSASVVRIGVAGGRGWGGPGWDGDGMMGGRGGRGFGRMWDWMQDQLNPAPSASPSADTQGG